MEESRNVHDSILGAIGGTPLVRLNRVTRGLPPGVEIWAKLEFLNPMGSVKDRIARYMIEKAERQGQLREGQLIIENSSGNTALGLALVAIQKGYRVKVVVRDRTSLEKVRQILALGVEIHFVDSTLPPEHPDSYNNITPRLVAETPGCYFPDQHNNRDNNEAHYRTTGPELWAQTGGQVDYLVAGVGTGGTLCGTARFLKERDSRIRTLAVDPVGSVFQSYFRTGERGQAAPYLIEGLGDEFLIGCIDFSVIDDMLTVADRDSFHAARRLVREEGILGGGSSGAALWASLHLARDLTGPARIVTIFPDGAARYLSTIWNDDWMGAHGLL